MNKENSKGFTLVEAVAAMTILVATISLALSGYMFLLKNANQADVQHELDIDVQVAIERLKKDLRLSSMDEIFGYPEGSPPYEAISFPIALVDANTGRLTRDPSTKEIIWDETVIYHIVPGTPDKLTRTVFTNRDNSLEDPERQAQLDHVVSTGGTSGAANSGNASSQIIFSNLLKWGLDPQRGLFSGYAAQPSREVISLGYALLDAYTNSFTFTVIGRNSSNTSDYKIGIDQIIGSPSYRYREAELQAMTYNGSSSPFVNQNSSYGNRSELLFQNCAVGDSITITLDNDRWEVADFNNLAGGGFSGRDKTIVETDYANNDVIVRLEGNELAWESELQTGDFSGFTSTSNLTGATVLIMQKGASLLANGSYIQSMGQRSYLTFQAASNALLKINNVYFGESASSNSIDWNFDSTKQLVYFNESGIKTDPTIPPGHSLTSEWIDMPIDENKNYIVQYTIEAANSLKMWADNTAIDLSTAATTRIITTTNGTYTAYILPALKSITASYVETGSYTSDIMDTQLDNPTYEYLSWDSNLPSGTTLAFKVRYSNLPDLSDTAEFKDIPVTFSATSSQSKHFISGTGRYVQFQAIMGSDSSTHLKTPNLKTVTIDWRGERRMVNIMGKFSKGPDFGDFELSVNGKPLQSALIINLEIFKTVQSVNGQTRKISSAIKAEITPRNSGL